jgi:outer membrane protein assembly factor BamE (lipoprotein component of BamABCDE complex)|tara:strand:- start:84 stop:425 length:342 start_codon:yes stop_codon:yes gene_type:complete
MKHFLSLLFVMLLAGCVVLPGKRVSFNDVKIGMPRDEAVAILGKPHRVSAKGNVEHLYYNESALYIGIFGVGKDPKQNRDLEVKIVDGKVESFGEVGEYFEEPEDPEKESKGN